MVDLVYYQTNLLLFDVLLLYFYINLRSSIIFCLSSGEMYLSLGIISLSCLFVIASELFCIELLETLVTLSAILLPIESPDASAVFFELLFLK